MAPSPKKPARGRPRKAIVSPAPESESVRSRRTGRTVSPKPEAAYPSPQKSTARAKSPAKASIKGSPAKANVTKKKVEDTSAKLTKPTNTKASKSPAKKEADFHSMWLERVRDGSACPKEIDELLEKYSDDMWAIITAHEKPDFKLNAAQKKVFAEAKEIKAVIDDMVGSTTFETEPFSQLLYREFQEMLSQCQAVVHPVSVIEGSSVNAARCTPPPHAFSSPRKNQAVTTNIAEGPFSCKWDSDSCGHDFESLYQLKTHILKHPIEPAEVYTCFWGKNTKCLFTSITPLSMKNHIWRDHLDHEDRPYVGNIDEKWVKEQPPFKKLAEEWKAKEVPEHMLKGDTRTSPLSGEEWYADMPPYFLAGDTAFSEHVASEQMTLDLINGARQLKSQPDITDKQWEEFRSGKSDKPTDTQRPASSGGGSRSFIKDSISSAIGATVDTIGSFIRPSPAATAQAKSKLSFWERQKQSWRLPAADSALLKRATELAKDIEAESTRSEGTAGKRKASQDSQGSRGAGKCRRLD